MSEPNLLDTDIQEQLRASVRDLLADHADAASVLARTESDSPYDDVLWGKLVDLGATSLHIPEADGGQGATFRETAVVAEELGASVAPVPFLGNLLASTVLLECRSDTSATALLGQLAAGERTATLAVPLSACAGTEFVATVRSDGGRLTGTVRSVVDAAQAQVFLVPAVGVDGLELHLVPAENVTVTPVVSFDLTRPVADLSLTGVESSPVEAAALSAVDSALTAGAGILAAEQVGIARWCLDTTVTYLMQRYQFGRQVGSFQSLKHRLADLWTELALARAAAKNAADELAERRDVEIAVHLAQSLCSEVAVHAAEECVQLHGGIGMTWEHPAHLYLKRAKADEIALGNPARHRSVLAGLVDLPL